MSTMKANKQNAILWYVLMVNQQLRTTGERTSRFLRLNEYFWETVQQFKVW